MTPDQEREGELFLEELARAPPESEVRWYQPVILPKATMLIFSDAELYGVICDFCRSMENLVVRDGRVVQVFCVSCRAILGNYMPCAGGAPHSKTRAHCKGNRFVDGVGAVAHLCRGCHQHQREAGLRTPASRGGRPRGRRGVATR